MRAGVMVAVAFVVMLAASSPAGAVPLPGAHTDGGEPTATVTNPVSIGGGPGGDGGGGGGGGGYCTYEELALPGPVYELPYGEGGGGEEGLYGTSATGRWAVQNCFNEFGQQVSSVVVPLIDDGGGGAVVDPQVLLQDALAKLRIPDPPLTVNPPVGSSSLVGVPVWLWLDGGYWQSASATASAGGASATVTAEPVSAAWKMGDGETVTCDGPGTPWTPAVAPAAASDCSHVYRRPSTGAPDGRFAVAVTVTWAVSWTSTVPGFGGDLDDLTRTATAELEVAEVQALADAR